MLPKDEVGCYSRGASQFQRYVSRGKVRLLILSEMVSRTSLERKRRSEAILQIEGVPVIAHLPVIEETTQIRPLEEVA